MSAFDDLAAIILGQDRKIEQLDRRVNNAIREARIVEVDAEKALVKVEAHGLKSGWAPWMERAGKIRSWTPPAVGERVLFVSPTGEPGQGIVLHGGYSDQFQAPSKNPDENVIAVGDLTITYNKDKAVILMKDGGKCVVTKDVAKIRKGQSWVVCTGDTIVVSENMVSGPDPDPN